MVVGVGEGVIEEAVGLHHPCKFSGAMVGVCDGDPDSPFGRVCEGFVVVETLRGGEMMVGMDAVVEAEVAFEVGCAG